MAKNSQPSAAELAAAAAAAAAATAAATETKQEPVVEEKTSEPPVKEGDVAQVGTDKDLSGDTKEPTVETKEPAPAPAPAPTPAPEAEKVEQVKMVESTVLSVIRAELAAYSEAMGKTQMQTAASAAAWQKRLYNTYMDAFKLSGPEFSVAINLFIETIKANETGAFSETLLNRALSHLALPAVKLRMFSHFNHLFTKAAEIGAKNAGREVDLNHIAKELVDEQSRQFLLAFFR